MGGDGVSTRRQTLALNGLRYMLTLNIVRAYRSNFNYLNIIMYKKVDVLSMCHIKNAIPSEIL